jgi:hypothetical protein
MKSQQKVRDFENEPRILSSENKRGLEFFCLETKQQQKNKHKKSCFKKFVFLC